MTILETRKLGQSNLMITGVGIGTAPIGSTPNWRINWGPQSEEDAIRAIETALDLGINWIDTAPFYGWGRAEHLVGKALKGKREKIYLFTKCGTIRDEQGHESENLTPANIRREIEFSLRNLQTDYIDLYQFHDPDPTTPIEESWMAVQQLIQEGKVRYAGLSNHTIPLIQRAQSLATITSNQHQYSMLYRDIEHDVLPFSQQQKIGVLCWSPLASGFLTDGFDLDALDEQDFRRGLPFAQRSRYTQIKQMNAKLMSIAHEHQRTLVELAIAWVLRQSAVTGAIIGIRNEQEARALPRLLEWKLTNDEIQVIDQILQHNL